MGRRVEVDVPKLFRLWSDDGMTRTEIARELGVTASQLTLLASRHSLRARKRQQRAFTMCDPTPEELEVLKAECRERHFAQRRGETEETTLQWRKCGGA